MKAKAAAVIAALAPTAQATTDDSYTLSSLVSSLMDFFGGAVLDFLSVSFTSWLILILIIILFLMVVLALISIVNSITMRRSGGWYRHKSRWRRR